MAFSNNFKTYHTYRSRQVKIGGLLIGGANPIPVQSMTNTNTLDTKATVAQIIRLAKAGCNIVRITAPGIKEAENLAEIKLALAEKEITIPIVADIHFNPKAAEIAAKYVEKVRINPGNYVDRNRGKTEWSETEILEARERIAERLLPLLTICRENKTAIRIGTNHGSLSERILSMYGNTTKGMVESAMEFVRICNKFGFHNLVLSMKASNVQDMTRANLLLVEYMIKEDYYYPVHLGVTEAGNGEEARIKSAAGIGSLLARGIGDTIRVSLAEMPVEEVPFGKRLVELFGRSPSVVEKILSSTTVLKPENNISLKEITGVKSPVVTDSQVQTTDLFEIRKNELKSVSGKVFSVEVANLDFLNEKNLLLENAILKRSYPRLNDGDLLIHASVDFALFIPVLKNCGIWIDNKAFSDAESLAELALKILQGLGIRYTNAEFVACPSCGRTKFNLFDSFNKVKEKTTHLKGLQIAVMGCIVNGPGEMGDADYGYVGAGPGKVTLYKNGRPELKNVDEGLAVNALINLIKEGGDWHNI